MNQSETATSQETAWFAIKTRQDFRAEEVLRPLCEEVFFPKIVNKLPGKGARMRAAIPHVLFIRTTPDKAAELERGGRADSPEVPVSFWVYRYPQADQMQVVPQRSIDLLRLLTAEDTSRCEIFNKPDFVRHDRVRIKAGLFKDYEGYVQRVRKDLHVVVEIEGICHVMLPFIHPDLLEKVQ